MQDSFGYSFGEISFFGEVLKDFSIPIDEITLSADIGDECSQAADVIGEGDAADDFNHDHPHSFVIGCGCDVSEADSQHDRGGPVVGPDVSLAPPGLAYPPGYLPVLFRMGSHHHIEDDGDGMREGQVEEHDLEQRPVSFIVFRLEEPPFDSMEFPKEGIDFECGEKD